MRIKHVSFIGLLIFLGMFFVCAMQAAFGETGYPENEDKEPTCTEKGYRVIRDEGDIRFEDIPATGHQFSEWMIDPEGKTKTHACYICGYEETIRISQIPEESLPKLELEGSMEGIGKKDRVALTAKYTDSEQSFQCLGLMTLQGHSTFGMPKKNYTIRFYHDAEGREKHPVVFRNWHKEHKYILKANYIDVSQCRNIAGAHLWSDIVKARKEIHPRLARLSGYGAVDGFPIAVYLNGDFFGLYTLNLHKDDDLYGMKEGRQEAIVICNQQTTDESLFRAESEFQPDDGSDWEIEFSGDEDESWAKESFNDLIAFVRESDDRQFREQLKEYLDTDAAIDYLLFIYALGLEDSGAKDLVMLSYGKQWIPSAYDMDEAFGLDAMDLVYRTPEVFLPSFEDGRWDSGTGSMLWDRLLNAFTEELKARYRELRGGPLSDKQLTEYVHQFGGQIPESYYDYDWYLYPGRPEMFHEMDQQIGKYIPARMKLLDRIFGGDGEA